MRQILSAEVLRKAGGDGEDTLGDMDAFGDRPRARPRRRGRPAIRRADRSRIVRGDPLPRFRQNVMRGEPWTASRRDAANAPEILLFTSLSVPAASWRQWARDAARIGAPLVMRGVAEGSLRATVKRIGGRLGGAEAGVAIDPRLFRLFGVTRVPAVVVVPGGVPPCRSPGLFRRSGAAPRPGDGKHRSRGRARGDRRRRQCGARRGEASPRKVEG